MGGRWGGTLGPPTFSLEPECSRRRAVLESHRAIHTENSHEYTAEILSYLQSRAGFVEEAAWTDERGWCRLQHWRIERAETI